MNTSQSHSTSSTKGGIAGLLSGDILDQYYPDGLLAAPGSQGPGGGAGGSSDGPGSGDGATGTQAKTCKPTRNPCCKPPEETTGVTGAPGTDDVQATKAKTCKPTRNPCCKASEELVEDSADVQATKAKTCKPTRNPCCKEA